MGRAIRALKEYAAAPQKDPLSALAEEDRHLCSISISPEDGDTRVK